MQPLPELMDQSALPLADTHRALADLDRVHRWLLGCHAVRRALLPRLRTQPVPQTALDLGTGSGQVAASTVDCARRYGINLRVVGVDRKLSHLLYGRRQGIPQLRVVADARTLPFGDQTVDWCISNLFFHHFTRDHNYCILAEMQRVATGGTLIVDLRRSWFAQRLIGPALRLLGVARVALHDGQISISNAWSLHEVSQLLDGQEPVELRRRFPYRFSLVLGPAHPPRA
ncbi:MAG: methyltransferase domain-containing protein [Thermoanaerobaculia bacterium]